MLGAAKAIATANNRYNNTPFAKNPIIVVLLFC
jgi:hypothetical protein